MFDIFTLEFACEKAKVVESRTIGGSVTMSLALILVKERRLLQKMAYRRSYLMGLHNRTLNPSCLKKDIVH